MSLMSYDQLIAFCLMVPNSEVFWRNRLSICIRLEDQYLTVRFYKLNAPAAEAIDLCPETEQDYIVCTGMAAVEAEIRRRISERPIV